MIVSEILMETCLRLQSEAVESFTCLKKLKMNRYGDWLNQAENDYAWAEFTLKGYDSFRTHFTLLGY